MFLSTLQDLWRTTFPKNLRYCRQCQILHAQLTQVNRRFRDKRFIPRADIRDVVQEWEPVPYSFMKVPLLRHVLFVKQINSMQCYRGNPSWLFTSSVQKEHDKIAEWFRVHGTRTFIPREQFEREVITPFHVATTYHRVFLLLATQVVLLIVFLLLADCSEHTMYVWLRLIRRMSKADIVDWYEQVMIAHTEAEVPEGFKNAKLPPTAFSDESGMVFFNVTEMTSPDKACRVTFIPHPRVGPHEMEQEVGRICRAHQAVVMEECALESLKLMPPAMFFRLKENTFPALGLHHRYWALLEPTAKRKDAGGSDSDKSKKKKSANAPSAAAVKKSAESKDDTASADSVDVASSTAANSAGAAYAGRSGRAAAAAAQEAAARAEAAARSEAEIATILETETPPMMLPGAGKPSRGHRLFLGLVPFALRTVYLPNTFMGTRGDARAGWGYLKDAISEDREGGPILSLAVPWTPFQSSNLKCSLLRKGWTVSHVQSMQWLRPRDVGESFCEFYGIVE